MPPDRGGGLSGIDVTEIPEPELGEVECIVGAGDRRFDIADDYDPSASMHIVHVQL